MNYSHCSTLNNRYDGQRIFNARKDGYSFDVFSDAWKIDYKNYLYLDWMNELDINVETLRISAIAIACFGIIRSLLFLTYSFTLTDRNPLFFSLIHPLIRSDGCCEPIDPVTHPLPLDFRSCCTIH